MSLTHKQEELGKVTKTAMPLLPDIEGLKVAAAFDGR